MDGNECKAECAHYYAELVQEEALSDPEEEPTTEIKFYCVEQCGLTEETKYFTTDDRNNVQCRAQCPNDTPYAEASGECVGRCADGSYKNVASATQAL